MLCVWCGNHDEVVKLLGKMNIWLHIRYKDKSAGNYFFMCKMYADQILMTNKRS